MFDLVEVGVDDLVRGYASLGGELEARGDIIVHEHRDATIVSRDRGARVEELEVEDHVLLLRARRQFVKHLSVAGICYPHLPLLGIGDQPADTTTYAPHFAQRYTSL